MRRRAFIAGLGILLARVPAAQAEPRHQIRKIGILTLYAEQDAQIEGLIKSFRTALEKLGWVEGRDVETVFRYAGGHVDRLRGCANELISENVDLILTHGTEAVQAAQSASRAVPIVFATIGDPVATKVVESIARPGNNVTGLSLLSNELGTKRLELLREIAPGSKRVAILTNPTNDSLAVQLEQTRKAARTLGIEATVLSVKGGDEFPKAIQAASDAKANSVLMMDETVQMAHRSEIAQLALQHGLILVGGFRETAEAGALVSYGPNRDDMWRRAAGYVDKIFAGSSPADLPIEQPVQFELFVNMKTAKSLGVTVSPEFLARADEVIE